MDNASGDYDIYETILGREQWLWQRLSNVMWLNNQIMETLRKALRHLS